MKINSTKTMIFSLSLWFFFAMLTAMLVQAAEFRNPTEMGDEDWDIINEARLIYHECLQSKMKQFGESSDDPRVISDKVLNACSGLLAKLERDMGERNINPHFTQRYIYNMKNRAARQLLRGLMTAIGQQQRDTNVGGYK